ncbi:MAG: type II toxin-antitoxin system HicA family toxin [Acidobacteria bacterium]|jgi:hypothetical protein|nr:type II toxin-antitoxin system HicA family toxin [Acidobacteriota bacterium]
MSKCEKLLAKAKGSTNNFRFADLCKLAECYGWDLKNQEGSHRIYKNAELDVTHGCRQTFQNENGKAKPYQVKQLLSAIEHLEVKNEK